MREAMGEDGRVCARRWEAPLEGLPCLELQVPLPADSPPQVVALRCSLHGGQRSMENALKSDDRICELLCQFVTKMAGSREGCSSNPRAKLGGASATSFSYVGIGTHCWDWQGPGSVGIESAGHAGATEIEGVCWD